MYLHSSNLLEAVRMNTVQHASHTASSGTMYEHFVVLPYSYSSLEKDRPEQQVRSKKSYAITGEPYRSNFQGHICCSILTRCRESFDLCIGILDEASCVDPWSRPYFVASLDSILLCFLLKNHWSDTSLSHPNFFALASTA